MRFEFVAKFVYESRRGHCRRIAEGADRVAHDVAADVQNQLEIARFTFAIFNAVKNLFHPVAAFPTWAALAAGLMGIETSDIPGGSDHAGRLVHADDAARTQEAARGRDGFIVEVNVFNFFGPQHRHGAAAGYDTFELFTSGNAAAVLCEKFLERVAQLELIDAGAIDVAADAEEFRPFALFRPDRGVGGGAVFKDPWESRQGFYVIYDRRTEKSKG